MASKLEGSLDSFPVYIKRDGGEVTVPFVSHYQGAYDSELCAMFTPYSAIFSISDFHGTTALRGFTREYLRKLRSELSIPMVDDIDVLQDKLIKDAIENRLGAEGGGMENGIASNLTLIITNGKLIISNIGDVELMTISASGYYQKQSVLDTTENEKELERIKSVGAVVDKGLIQKVPLDPELEKMYRRFFDYPPTKLTRGFAQEAGVLLPHLSDKLHHSTINIALNDIQAAVIGNSVFWNSVNEAFVSHIVLENLGKMSLKDISEKLTKELAVYWDPDVVTKMCFFIIDLRP